MKKGYKLFLVTAMVLLAHHNLSAALTKLEIPAKELSRKEEKAFDFNRLLDELQCAVIEQFSNRELFNARPVCKKWAEIIEGTMKRRSQNYLKKLDEQEPYQEFVNACRNKEDEYAVWLLVIKKVLNKKPRQTNHFFDSLYFAVKYGLDEVVDVLLDAKVKFRGKVRFNVIIFQVNGDVLYKVDGVGILTQSEVDDMEMSYLHIAAQYGFATILRKLLTVKKNLNFRDRWGKTPLHYACECGHAHIARLLLEAGADPVVKTTIPLSVKFEQRGLANFSITLEPSEFVVSGQEKTGYDLALEHGYTEVVEVFKSFGFDGEVD